MGVTPEVVIFVGLQGSGKSSFYRARFATSHLHLSKDNWPHTRRREVRLQRELRAALQNGQRVVIDNTNVTRERRASVLAIAQELNAHVIGYVFESNLDDCLKRNAERSGKARVPEVALYANASQWKTPTYEEGFDELYFVRLQDGAFEVTPLENSDEPRSI